MENIGNNNLFVTVPQNFSNTSSQEDSPFFSQHCSYPMSLLCTMQLVQLIVHVGTPSPLLLSTLFSTPNTLYPSFCVPYLTHILYQLPLATPGTYKNPLPLTVHHLESHAIDPISIPRVPHNITLTYIHYQLSSFTII